MKSELKNRSKLFEQVISACRFILKTDAIAAHARDYINNRISEEEQEKYGIGYFPSDDQLDYLKSLVDKDVLEKLLLIYPRYISGGAKLHGQFDKHNLVMPFRNAHGDIIFMLGRHLGNEDVQKYKYTLGSHKDLFVFNLDRAKQSIIQKNCIICVEGQFDAIACQAAGITNVVALGWANCSAYQFAQMLRYTNNFVLLLDSDEAGRRAKLKIKKKFGSYANIKTISQPKGVKDIDEFMRDCKDTNQKQKVVDILKGFHG